jgi:hypothetical protein
MLAVLVGSNDNDGPELDPDDGSVLTAGNLLDSDDGTILTLGVMLGKAAGSVDTDGPILGSIKGFMLFDASTLGCPLGERETEGDALASTFGDFDVEGNALGLMDGFMLLLGKILAMLVVVGSNNNDGPKLYPGDGPILVVRKSVGLDDGAMLKLGAMLGKVAGSIDTDGPTLGSNEGFMLFDGSTLGCSLGEKEMDGDAVDTTQISSHVTSNIKWHCFAKLLEGKEQSGEATSDTSEPSSRFIDVSYNQSLISATPSTQEDVYISVLVPHIKFFVFTHVSLPRSWKCVASSWTISPPVFPLLPHFHACSIVNSMSVLFRDIILMGDFKCQIGHISTKCSDPYKFEHVLGDEVGSMDGKKLGISDGCIV